MSYAYKKKILILASRSYQRKKILKDIRLNFKVIYPSVKEVFFTKNKDIVSLVKYNASLKVDSVKDRLKEGIVIGLDTLVLFKKRIIGKLNNLKEARRLLKEISGKKISVYTGICLMDLKSQRKVCDYERTAVYVRKVSKKKIDRYIKYLGPYDKAGGFSIEGLGSVLFDKLEGSYLNVLGLPLQKLDILLERMGLDILDFIKR